MKIDVRNMPQIEGNKSERCLKKQLKEHFAIN